jgi:hypothetical protein
MTQEQPQTQDQSQDEELALPFSVRLKEWFFQEGAWWGASFVFHALLMVLLMLISKTVHTKVIDEAPSIEEAQLDKELTPETLEKFDVGDTPIDPAELNTETLTMNEAPKIEAADVATVGTGAAEMASTGTGNAAGAVIGGLGGFDFKALGSGPAGSAKGVIGAFGSTGGGGGGTGFGARGAGARKAMVGGFGGTKHSERAVAAALNWIGRHQNRDGSWSLEAFNRSCKDATCSGSGSVKSDVAATALALLPFLAAGQTHESRGPYKANIHNGLVYLLKTQKRDGSLWGNSSQKMYTHGLAAITLCEAYGLTGDKNVGVAAQGAINYIQSVQHPRTGGWRYSPGDEGDTSVVGWMAMAMKSGMMSSLNVSQPALQGVKHWLTLCAAGKQKGLFSYTPGSGPSPSMTAVGLLLLQYAGMTPDSPAMKEGVSYIMSQMPDARRRSLYYWYYATQVMHNIPGPDWDKWNRAMRRVLIETQVKEGCAAGSWDPMRPTRELLGESGGRLCVTSLSALTLEVYYRYLPLYKLDTESAVPDAVKASTPEGAMNLEQAAAAVAKQNAAKPAAGADKAEKKDAGAKKDAAPAAAPADPFAKPAGAAPADPFAQPAGGESKPKSKAKKPSKKS